MLKFTRILSDGFRFHVWVDFPFFESRHYGQNGKESKPEQVTPCRDSMDVSVGVL